MVFFFLFLNILCRRDGSRTCLVCCHFSFDVASIHEMPSVSFHLNLETLKLLLSQSSCFKFFSIIQRTQIWVISRCCSADLRPEICKDFLPTGTAFVLLIKRFCVVSCRVVPVAVAVVVVVFLNSLFKSALYFFCYWSFPGPFVPSRLSCFAPLLKSMFSMLSMLNVRLICYVTQEQLGKFICTENQFRFLG